MTTLRYGLRITLAFILLAGCWYLSFLGRDASLEERVQDTFQYQQAESRLESQLARLESQLEGVADGDSAQITEYGEFKLNPLVQVSFFITGDIRAAELKLRAQPALIIPSFLIYALLVALNVVGLSVAASQKDTPTTSERLLNANENPYHLLIAECRNFDEEVARMQREGSALLWMAVLLATIGLCILIWFSGEHVLSYAKQEIARQFDGGVSVRDGLPIEGGPTPPGEAEASVPSTTVEGHDPVGRLRTQDGRLESVPWGWYIAWVAMQAVAVFFLAVYRISMGRMMDLYGLRNHRVEQLVRWAFSQEEGALPDLTWIVAAEKKEP